MSPSPPDLPDVPDTRAALAALTELGVIFKRWYPDMDLEVDEMPVAA
jgi:hypothetical protein